MLLRIFDRCQKWIVNYNRLVLFYLIILIIISLIIDEKNSFANCQELGSKNDLMTLNSAISSRQTIPEFFSNNPAFATLLATLPSKLIGLVILRYIKQQQMQNQFVPIGGFNGGNNCDGNGKGGKRGNNCNGNGNGNGFGNNGGNGNDDDDNRPERTLMFFAGNGNIQVKNHKGNDGDDEEGDDDDDDLEKHYTLQVIDEEKKVANLDKDMNGFNRMIGGLGPRKANKRSGKLVNTVKINKKFNKKKFKGVKIQKSQ